MSSLQYQLILFWSFNSSSMHNGNGNSSLIQPELDWNVAEDWWFNGGGSLS